jgi:outer membrane lipoprotein SlyB
MGLFPDRQHTESTLSQLKAAGFPMSDVSVVVQDLNSEDATLKNLAEPIVQSEDRFVRQRTIEHIEHGALDAGVLGSIGGGLIAGFTLLTLPGSGGFTLLMAMAAGAYYGAVSGVLLGAAFGGVSDEQEQHYNDRLKQGCYLVVIKGTDPEISQAEAVLKTANIQDWMIVHTL